MREIHGIRGLDGDGLLDLKEGQEGEKYCLESKDAQVASGAHGW